MTKAEGTTKYTVNMTLSGGNHRANSDSKYDDVTKKFKTLKGAVEAMIKAKIAQFLGNHYGQKKPVESATLTDASGEVLISYGHKIVGNGTWAGYDKFETLEIAESVQAEVEAIADKWAARNAETVKAYEAKFARYVPAERRRLEECFKAWQYEKAKAEKAAIYAAIAAAVIEDVEANDDDEEEIRNTAPVIENDDDDDELDDARIDALAATTETTEEETSTATEEIEYGTTNDNRKTVKLNVRELKAARSIMKELLAESYQRLSTRDSESAAVAIAMIDRLEEMGAWNTEFGTQMKWSALIPYGAPAYCGEKELKEYRKNWKCNLVYRGKFRLDAYSMARGLSGYFPWAEYINKGDQKNFNITNTHDLDKFSFNHASAAALAVYVFEQVFDKAYKIDSLPSCYELSGSKYRPTNRKLAYKIFHLVLAKNCLIEDVEANDEPEDEDEIRGAAVVIDDSEDEDDDELDDARIDALAATKETTETTLFIKDYRPSYDQLGIKKEIKTWEAKYAEKDAWFWRGKSHCSQVCWYWYDRRAYYYNRASLDRDVPTEGSLFMKAASEYTIEGQILLAIRRITFDKGNPNGYYDSPEAALARLISEYPQVAAAVDLDNEFVAWCFNDYFPREKAIAALNGDLSQIPQKDPLASVEVEEYAATPEAHDAAIEGEIENAIKATAEAVEAPAREPADIHFGWLVENLNYCGGLKTRKIHVVRTITVASVDEAREFVIMKSDKHLAPLSVREHAYCGQKTEYHEYGDMTLNVREYTYSNDRYRRPIAFEIDDFNHGAGTFAVDTVHSTGFTCYIARTARFAQVAYDRWNFP